MIWLGPIEDLHNLFLDTDSQILYFANGEGGLLKMDLSVITAKITTEKITIEKRVTGWHSSISILFFYTSLFQI